MERQRKSPTFMTEDWLHRLKLPQLRYEHLKVSLKGKRKAEDPSARLLREELMALPWKMQFARCSPTGIPGPLRGQGGPKGQVPVGFSRESGDVKVSLNQRRPPTPLLRQPTAARGGGDPGARSPIGCVEPAHSPTSASALDGGRLADIIHQHQAPHLQSQGVAKFQVATTTWRAPEGRRHDVVLFQIPLVPRMANTFWPARPHAAGVRKICKRLEETCV